MSLLLLGEPNNFSKCSFLILSISLLVNQTAPFFIGLLSVYSVHIALPFCYN